MHPRTIDVLVFSITYQSIFKVRNVERWMMPMQEEFVSCLSDFGMAPAKAYQQISLELEGDGDPYMDLGSFTAVRMEPEADRLICDHLGKNLANQNEYGETTHIHKRLVQTIADLLGAPNVEHAAGCSTSGSSEACAIAMLMHKLIWQASASRSQLQRAPNIVLGRNAHLVWRKFALYLGVEVREASFKRINRYPLQNVVDLVDENTICVVAVMGSTFSGFCDPIEKINDALMKLNARNGWNVGIHVDGAIGGFILPFLEDPAKPVWDFALPLVRSINLSGHKFGLVYPGLGWLILRDQSIIPDAMNMTASYLTGNTQSYAISFSRSSSLVVAQYFNFLHFGRAGYGAIIERCMKNARYVAASLEAMGCFDIISTLSLPVITFSLKSGSALTEEALCRDLGERGWMLPHFAMPQNIGCNAMRIVIREDMTRNRLDALLDDVADILSKQVRCIPPLKHAI
ncbi:glutamate decarboxylase [Cohaesibacter marisflavi]|uniref:Glutamate decarboxylase n=2 Tax=Cohaesibacter marisflavi TaxID=655353 RepID=A0A1I5CSC8_9HYPH|nr:glutamate decarboxylase [Cohaesibacter marisflavi]